ncbi:MAG: hypothetical protein JO112_21695 [Planctomycetes bacterium]|nr:hypothetical protein [Planctomycetota bacterium]
MAVTFPCPCGRQFRVEANQLGTTVRCPHCGRLVQLPALGVLETPAQVPPAGKKERTPSPTTRRPWIWLRPGLAAALVLLVALGFLLAWHSLASSARRRPGLSSSPDSTSLAREAPAAKQLASPSSQAKTLADSSPQAPAAIPAYPATSPLHLPAESPRPSVPAGPAVPPRTLLAGRPPYLKEGDRFSQEVVVSRSSLCQVLGTDYRNQARFAFLSSFQVNQISEKGLVLTQKVEAVRLEQAGPDQQAGLADLLRQTRGTTLRITLGTNGDVTGLEGAPSFGSLSSLTSPESLTLSLQPTLDPDAWKELAQLTFFQPPDALRQGGRWSRNLTHDWGALGGWTGQVLYQLAARAPGVERYDYRFDLAYRPPQGSGGGLSSVISGADFKLVNGGGSIAYNPDRGRVTAAEERFHVRGQLALTVLGETTPAGLEELQHFQLRILDQMPDPAQWSAIRP